MTAVVCKWNRLRLLTTDSKFCKLKVSKNPITFSGNYVLKNRTACQTAYARLWNPPIEKSDKYRLGEILNEKQIHEYFKTLTFYNRRPLILQTRQKGSDASPGHQEHHDRYLSTLFPPNETHSSKLLTFKINSRNPEVWNTTVTQWCYL